MTAQTDRRRATTLMREARTLALDLIDEDVWGFRQIALRSYPLVEYAAKLTPKTYTFAEANRVFAKASACEAKLAAVGAD